MRVSKAGIKTACVLLVTTLLASCSTTRVLPEDAYRLASNKIEIQGDARLSSSDLAQYVKQKPNTYFILGWNPFLNIYNWQRQDGKGLSGVWKRIGVAPVQYDPSLVRSSCENIAGHLEYLGYYNSEVESRVEMHRRLASVHYVVKPGTRIQIDSIVYELPDNPEFKAAFTADSLNMTVKVGDYISEKDLEAETVRGADYFRNLGYYNFSKGNYFFVADTLSGPTILRYQIRPYTRNESAQNAVPIQKFTIGEVRMTHSADVDFRDDILRKLNVITPGSAYSERLVNTSYNRLSALKVFNGVGIELTPTDSATVNCSIRLSDSKQQGIKADIEASTNSSGLMGLSPQLSLYHKNVFHGGEWLTVGFTGNFQFKPRSDVHSTEFGTTVGLSLPRFVGIPYSRFSGSYIPRTEVNASFNYQNRPEYTRTIAGFSYGYSGQVGRTFFYQAYPVQANFVRLYNLNPEFEKTLEHNPYLRDSYQNHLDAGLGTMLYYTTNADIVPKTSYRYARLNFDLSGNLMSLLNPVLKTDQDGHDLIFGVPFTQYVRAELNLGNTWRFGRNDGQAVALHLVSGVGYAYGNSVVMPFEKQFYVGGSASMRGWQVRSLGPGTSMVDGYFSIPSQTGDFKMEFDAEYRFRTFWKLEGALFAEVGNIYNMQDMSARNILPGLAGDWGFGARVDLDFILLRLDMGFKVHDPSREEGARWVTPRYWLKRDGFAIHFGVGYPF